MTTKEIVEKLERLKANLEDRTDITVEEYKKFKELYTLTLEYWKEQLELENLENEHLL